MRVRLANFSVARVRKFAVARVRLANFSVGGVRLATLSMASQRQLQRVCTNFRADSLSPLLLIYILILLFSILERESLHCRLSKSVCNADSFWQSAMPTLFTRTRSIISRPKPLSVFTETYGKFSVRSPGKIGPPAPLRII